MATSTPRRSTFEVRDNALSRALQTIGYSEKSTPDSIVDAAKTFETYLTGSADAGLAPRHQRVVEYRGDSETAGYGPTGSSTTADADERWRMDVENLPLDGSVKLELDSGQIAYRIEALARVLLIDPHETPENKQAALDELRATTNSLVDVLTDGAE